MLRKVYQAQKDDQTNGDFADLVTKYLLSLNITYEEVTSNALCKTKLKKMLKASAQSVSSLNFFKTYFQHTQK